MCTKLKVNFTVCKMQIKISLIKQEDFVTTAITTKATTSTTTIFFLGQSVLLHSTCTTDTLFRDNTM